MRKKKQVVAILLLVSAAYPLQGGTGRPEDGLLFSLALLAFLGIILGIIHLAECIPALIEKIISKMIGDITPSNGDLV